MQSLIGRRARLPTRGFMRNARSAIAYQAWLWGEVLLIGLLGAALALFVTYPSLRNTYELPQLRLVLDTAVTLAAAIVAVLAGIRFSVEGRRLDLLLCGGFFVAAASTMVFAVAPVLGGGDGRQDRGMGRRAGKLFAAALIAAAPFSARHDLARGRALARSSLSSRSCSRSRWWHRCSRPGCLPALDRRRGTSRCCSIVALAVQAAPRADRARRLRPALPRPRETTSTAGSGSPRRSRSSPSCTTCSRRRSRAAFVSQGDFLRLLSYGVLLAGVWRAMRFAEFGRAVAEERARVAREIHDGLAQYLFAISTHASMLEAGAEPERTLAQMKKAAAAAQQEARFAILALSSAERQRALRRRAPPLRRLPHRRRRSSTSSSRSTGRPARARRADRGLPDRPGGARERPQARRRAAAGS